VLPGNISISVSRLQIAPAAAVHVLDPPCAGERIRRTTTVSAYFM
jgi:hypothetical protein